MIALLCILGLLAALMLWLPRRSAADAAAPRLHLRGAPAADAPPPIPRIIWTYWHTPERPQVVRRCLHNWAECNPGYEVRCVSAADLALYVDEQTLPAGFSSLTPARQSDVLRLYFLQRYGGIWLDASIILTRSLDWMRDLQQQNGVDYVGFYLDRYTTQPECPVIDSWCMAAPPGRVFVADWLEEFSGRALSGDVNAYVAAIEARPDRERIVQKIDSPGYMAIHVCAQVVLTRTDPRLCLVRAEDSAYFYQARGRWKRAWLFISLLILRRPAQPPALVKLRGGERRKLEPYLRRGWYSRNSLIGRHLGAEANG